MNGPGGEKTHPTGTALEDDVVELDVSPVEFVVAKLDIDDEDEPVVELVEVKVEPLELRNIPTPPATATITTTATAAAILPIPLREALVIIFKKQKELRI